MPIMKTAATTLTTLVLLVTIPALAQDSETRVKMKDLPGPVQQTVKEQGKGAVIRGLAKEVKDGQTFYEVELKAAGHNKDVLIDPSGKVVEIEEQVTLDSLPPAVKAEIIKQAGKRRIVMVESITKDNALVAYEAHVKSGLRTLEIKVGVDGKLITQ